MYVVRAGVPSLACGKCADPIRACDTRHIPPGWAVRYVAAGRHDSGRVGRRWPRDGVRPPPRVSAGRCSCPDRPDSYSRHMFSSRDRRSRSATAVRRRLTEADVRCSPAEGTGMDVASFLRRLTSHPDYAGQLVHVEQLAERPGRFAAPQQPAAGRAAASAGGVRDRAALRASGPGVGRGAGRTGLGWSSAARPAARRCATTCRFWKPAWPIPQARRLYLFPTKALAQDQLKGQLELLAGRAERAAGHSTRASTTATRRPPSGGGSRPRPIWCCRIPTCCTRRSCPIIPKWSRFFSELKFVVLDEVHTYRGILGAHVACVLRRLMRVCQHYGAQPGVPGRQRHDRQPGRTGLATDRPAGRGDRQRRVAARPQVLCVVEPGRRRAATRWRAAAPRMMPCG